ncbi:MAG TPA: bifunctional acetate--CoA ligase family protein/GNAT family N-acetyltransferase [Isosphaeraceae bacterium]|nr:bifunctional acetate--CoA ligase family protein/GNAT family N-acetyltransferase [Isosphaeraceae bacterium]
MTRTVQDPLGHERSVFDALFNPRNVAVIGATDRPGSVGRALLDNLVQNSFGGTVFPVNQVRPDVLGIKAYPNIEAVPEPVDLAVVVTPAPTVPDIVRQCVDAKVRMAIVISAGFRETGAAGAELEQRTLAEARRGGMRIVGPNCLGVMRPSSGLNATFASAMAQPGSIGFLSQSGALGTAILDWSLREQVGFSVFASLGSMLDVAWADLIDYLADDPQTKSIVIYMESIRDPRTFLSSAREVSFTKPILVIKAGRTENAAKAVVSHTGSLAGSDDALEAAFRRAGVFRVNTIEELFAMAQVLAKQPRPRGPRLSILTNAGGPGVLATDALIGAGGTMAQLAAGTMEALDRVLPSTWSHANPIDILGDADPARYEKAAEIAAADPNTDGLLVILTPQAMTDPTKTAQCLTRFASLDGKPILASWMGGSGVAEGQGILSRAGIPTLPYPEAAACAFRALWQFHEIQRSLYETPSLPPDDPAGNPDRELAQSLLKAARSSRQPILNEYDSKRLLTAYRIPTVETRLGINEAEAVTAAESIGYPVVLKLHSSTITHKTDVGGVRLAIKNASAVVEAYRAIAASVTKAAGSEHFQGVTVQPMIALQGYELLIGSSVDPQLGPVLLFGSGGVLAEVYRDRALALPPLNTTLARRMMERTKIFKALKGVRGRAPVNIAGLEHLLVRFSQLVAEQPWIKEIDINPLLASPSALIALDARVVVHGPDMTLEQLPSLAIRPYPERYVQPFTLADGTVLTIRPVRPEDEPLFVRFHQTLSEESVYLRYFHPAKLSRRVAHERLARICFIDYDREMALVAETLEPGTLDRAIVGVGRIIKLHHSDTAEFAVIVSDAYQRKGIGTELLRRLIQIARDEKLRRLTLQILPENRSMLRSCQKVGATSFTRVGYVVQADIDVSAYQPKDT